jgi:hypothetical protein
MQVQTTSHTKHPQTHSERLLEAMRDPPCLSGGGTGSADGPSAIECVLLRHEPVYPGNRTPWTKAHWGGLPIRPLLSRCTRPCCGKVSRRFG